MFEHCETVSDDAPKPQTNIQKTNINNVSGSSKNILWVQDELEKGTWVACAKCSRWRHLPMLEDPSELPDLWYCHMNPDSAAAAASCGLAQAVLSVEQEEGLVETAYAAGSVVWARLSSWPAWPALVDHSPDDQLFYWLDGFSDIPTHYHVVFFDDKKEPVTRAWIPQHSLTPYKNFDTTSAKIPKKFHKRINVAKKQASEALKLTLEERLRKFGFLANYKGSKKSSRERNHNKNIRRLEANNNKLANDIKSWPAADSTVDDEIGEPLLSKKRKTVKTRSEHTLKSTKNFTEHSKQLPNTTVDLAAVDEKGKSSKPELDLNTPCLGGNTAKSSDNGVSEKRADDDNNHTESADNNTESTANIENPSEELREVENDASKQWQQICKKSLETFVELKASVSIIGDSGNETYEDHGIEGMHTNDGNSLIPSTIIDNVKTCISQLQSSQGSDDFEF